MTIPFTQYLMPDGRKSLQLIDMDEETENKAQEILDAGYAFEMEMLRDYKTCSFSIFDPRRDCDVAMEIAVNGPPVLVAIKKLIMDFKLDE